MSRWSQRLAFQRRDIRGRIEINGEMVADVSGEDVERYLIEHNLVRPNETDAGVPINAPCANEQHGEPVKLKF